MIPHYNNEWSSEDVAKGLQDWLICIEMFIAAIVHTFVFPHTDYLEPLGIMHRADHHVTHGSRRVGRRSRYGNRVRDDKSAGSKNSIGDGAHDDLELGPTDPLIGNGTHLNGRGSILDESESGSSDNNPRHERKGFVSALLDSTVPRDIYDESVGIFKGEFNVEKKTLLHHAATSDEYDLFSKTSKRRRMKLGRTGVGKKKDEDVGVPDSIVM